MDSRHGGMRNVGYKLSGQSDSGCAVFKQREWARRLEQMKMNGANIWRM
jgi:hypothetical protein